ncbi:MAG: hypothetical protein AAF702_11575 [Chloroflexota bacterium]
MQKKNSVSLFELARWILIPYLALVAGHLSPRFMGLVGVNWPTTLAVGLGIGFTVMMLVAITRATNIPYPFLQAVRGSYREPTIRSRVQNEEKQSGWLWLWSQSLAQAFYWTFVRAALWEILIVSSALVDSPLYTAVWLATIIIAVEAIPMLITNSRQWFDQLFTLLLTSVLFLYTQNFYLCAILHSALTLLIRGRIENRS